MQKTFAFDLNQYHKCVLAMIDKHAPNDFNHGDFDEFFKRKVHPVRLANMAYHYLTRNPDKSAGEIVVLLKKHFVTKR